MKTTKVGLIGCGNISGQYFQWFQSQPNVKIDACADLDFSRANARAGEFGVRPLTVDQLLNDPEIEIVLNLTIPKAHVEVNMAALSAGKHVYCEKPFALDLQAGIDAIQFANKAGLRVGCAPDTFMGAGLQTCRKLVDDGVIGVPIAAACNYAHHGPDPFRPVFDYAFVYQKGGGPMLDMGPYYVTALINFIGPIHRVSGAARASFPERIVGAGEKKGTRIPVEVPTYYAAVFEFASGAIATACLSFDLWGHNLPKLEIYGSEGTLSVPDPNWFEGPVRLLRPGAKEWTDIPLIHSRKTLRGIGVSDMAEAIVENRPHRASGQLALHALEAMLAVEKAVGTGAYCVLKTTCERPDPLPET